MSSGCRLPRPPGPPGSSQFGRRASPPSSASTPMNGSRAKNSASCTMPRTNPAASAPASNPSRAASDSPAAGSPGSGSRASGSQPGEHAGGQEDRPEHEPQRQADQRLDLQEAARDHDAPAAREVRRDLPRGIGQHERQHRQRHHQHGEQQRVGEPERAVAREPVALVEIGVVQRRQTPRAPAQHAEDDDRRDDCQQTDTGSAVVVGRHGHPRGQAEQHRKAQRPAPAAGAPLRGDRVTSRPPACGPDLRQGDLTHALPSSAYSSRDIGANGSRAKIDSIGNWKYSASRKASSQGLGCSRRARGGRRSGSRRRSHPRAADATDHARRAARSARSVTGIPCF